MTTKQFNNYPEYLSLEALLASSNFLEDDEEQRCFLICHQISELWFKVAITELERFIRTAQLSHLLRAEAVVRQVNGVLDVLESIGVREFGRIRSQLQGISGAGSAQFFQLDQLVDQCKGACESGETLAALSRIDTALARWKFSHALLSKKLIGESPGTGGTDGAGYLMKRGFDPKVSHAELVGDDDSSVCSRPG